MVTVLLMEGGRKPTNIEFYSRKLATAEKSEVLFIWHLKEYSLINNGIQLLEMLHE